MRPATSHRRRGFTLIELMITVVIVGILAAIAYPNLVSYIQRSRRADAVAELSSIVQAQERYRSNNTAYASTLTTVGFSGATKYYDYTLESVSEPPFVAGYQVTARPKSDSAQAGDAQDCATLSVRLEGSVFKYLATGSGDRVTSDLCWAH